MKSTRACPKCNWEYPLSFHRTACKFCKTVFNEQFCNACEVWLPTGMFMRDTRGVFRRECTPCRKSKKKAYDKANPKQKYERDKRFFDKRRQAAADLYDDWLAKTKVPFKPLSEQDWLAACSYFKGCALCGEEHIESRDFLVGFQHGGRYASWNVFPTCGKCATSTRFVENPFVWLDRYVGYSGLSDARRDKLLKYFTEKLGELDDTKT